MFGKRIILLVLIILLSCINVTVFAEDMEKNERVVVTGLGINADIARQNAIRNAVEQIVGTFVSSDTIVQNGALIKDEILSFSGGYVKEIRMLSTARDGDLIRVKLEALVISTKLKKKIQALNISLKKVDGTSLFGEAFSKSENQKNTEAQLLNVLNKYPQAAYHLELGKPEIISVDHNTNKAQIKIKIVLTNDNDFINELESVLKAVCYKQLTDVDISKWGWDENKISGRENYLNARGEWMIGSPLIKNGDVVFMFTNLNLYKRDYATSAYFVSISPRLLKDENSILKKMIAKYHQVTRMAVIKLIDSTGNVLDLTKVELPDFRQSTEPPPFIYKFLYGYRFPSDDDNQNSYNDIMFLINNTQVFEIKIQKDISLLKKITSIKASFDPFTQK